MTMFSAREWAHIHMCARRFTIAELCGMEDMSRERGDHDAAARYRWAIAIRAIDGGDRNGEDQNDQARVLDR